MGNFKDFAAMVDKLVATQKPFLIIKYGLTFKGISNNVYEVVTLGRKRLQYTPIERDVAMSSIEKHHLPLLHELDSRNSIWGDEGFKDMYQKMRSDEEGSDLGDIH